MTSDIEVCRQALAEHSKSFNLASKLLPRYCRDHAAVVYAWCRRADDAVDFSTGSEQLNALTQLREELKSIYAGAAQSEVTLRAFQQVVQHCAIPIQYPDDLLKGMQMDVENYRYQSLDDILLYSYRVASTVGLMMSHVMGVSAAGALRHAAHLGLGMQLTNICRDVLEDWQRQRLYLPNELLARYGSPDLGKHLGKNLPEHGRLACRSALQDLLRLAARYYASGDDGLPYLSARCAISVGAARRVYSAIGSQIAEQSYDVLAPRAVVPRRKKLILCGAAVLRTLSDYLVRGRRRFEPVLLETVSFDANIVSL